MNQEFKLNRSVWLFLYTLSILTVDSKIIRALKVVFDKKVTLNAVL